MRKTKEVLRLKFELGLGQRQIARSCGMGLGTVHDYLERAVAAGIGWPLPGGWSEEELEAKLFGNQPERARAVQQRPQPDWKAIHEQLQQHRHLTLQLLWEEYRQANPEGYGFVASPASDYLRALPPWTSREYSGLRRNCVLYSDKGSFGWQVARGVLESAQGVVQSVELIPMHSPLKNSDAIRSVLFEISPEVVVLAGSFQDELMIMRGRPYWPATVRSLAAVAAGIHAFSAQLGGLADGVVGPSQWEPGVSLPEIRGPTSDWFADSFEKQFGSPPDYVAAGSFATGVIVTECIRRAASLDNDRLRSIASDLDCNTFYGRFRIDAQSGKQVGHRMLLIRWREGRKVVLPS